MRAIHCTFFGTGSQLASQPVAKVARMQTGTISALTAQLAAQHQAAPLAGQRTYQVHCQLYKQLIAHPVAPMA
jgi:hypothetical protein